MSDGAGVNSDALRPGITTPLHTDPKVLRTAALALAHFTGWSWSEISAMTTSRLFWFIDGLPERREGRRGP